MAYDKYVIAQNIQFLRKSADMTQSELAEKMNYSDKAVSKWEKGNSLPDIFAMKTMADIFGVSLDYFFEEHSKKEVEKQSEEQAEQSNKKHLRIALVSVLGLWLAATTAFLIVKIITHKPLIWYIFPICVPVSALILLIFNQIWGQKKHTVYLVSALIWTALIAFAVGFYGFNRDVWRIILIGIPAEAVTVIACRLGRK